MHTVKVTLPDNTRAFSLAQALLTLAEAQGLTLTRNARGYVLSEKITPAPAGNDEEE